MPPWSSLLPSIRQYLPSRRTAKFTLFAVAAVSAVVTVRHLRRYQNQINHALQLERTIATNQLREAFVSHQKTAQDVYIAFLDQAKRLLDADERVQTQHFLQVLRNGVDREEKTRLWREIMIASVTHLLSYSVMAAALWCMTCVQVHLLGRYSQSVSNAPVQELPFTVDQQRSKEMLMILKDGMSNFVDDIASNVRAVVSTITVSFSKRMGSNDVHSLFTECINSCFETFPDVNKWLTHETTQQFQVLYDELLDTCDVLDVKSYIHHASLLTVHEAGKLYHSEQSQPFAKLFASFADIAKKGCDSFTERLSSDAQCTQLSASVFLSGGKEPPRSETSNWDSLLSDF